MKIEVKIRLLNYSNVEILSKALEPDNLNINSYESNVSCENKQDFLECTISGNNVMKIKSLFNDLMINIDVILKALDAVYKP